MAGSFLVYLAVHTVCFALNLFASGGYPRFLVAVAAPVAILGAAGLEGLLGLARRGDARVAWLGLGLWAAMAVGADVEMGRFVRLNPGASPCWPLGQWLARGVLAATLVVFVGRRLKRRAGWAAFTLRGLVVIGVLVHGVNFAVFVRLPIRRTGHQAQLVAAARWTAARYPGRPILGSSRWVEFGLDQTRRVDMPFPWERLDRAAPGTLYLCDIAGPGDYRFARGAPPIAWYEQSPRFRRRPLPGADRGRIALFEKVR